MNNYPLGWQSWSPPTPIWYGLPRWDYCPVVEMEHQKVHAVHKRQKGFSYWCSYYAFGFNINETKILKTANAIRKYNLAIDYIIIDEGWTRRGNWLHANKKRFPHGIAWLAKKLHKLGFKVGLWITPFLGGRIDYKRVFPTLIKKWDIDLLKLDFLFAPYFAKGLRDDNAPHRELTKLFQYLRTKYPKTVTVASGCPFTPALGLVDIIRISKDSTEPPPTPLLIRKYIYCLRMQLLQKKYYRVPRDFAALPDPDVRLVSLDNRKTRDIWDTIHTRLKGVGDNILLLKREERETVRIWLQ